MSQSLPNGWSWSTLGALGRYVNGRGFKKSEWRESGRPIIRIQNLTGSSDGFNYYQGEADERHVVRPGDLLVSWAATLGVYIWRGEEALLNQHIFKVESYVQPAFHRWLLEYTLGDLYRQAHGSGMVHITKTKFEATPVPVPPADEQERIVTAIEEHLSRLDAAEAGLQQAVGRCELLRKRTIVEAVPVEQIEGWDVRTVANAGESGLGRQRSPKFHSGPNMKPYLRVANVFEDRIDIGDVMEMHFDDVDFDKYRLNAGDILLNEGQSPEFLGRPAMYRGQPADTAFTNSLIRFVAGNGILPEWALLVFRRHMHSGRFMQESKITTNIAHLALGRFRTVEFPVPPEEEQAEIVKATEVRLAAIEAQRSAVEMALARAKTLRRSILSAAFSGQLVPQDPSDESAADLLQRIAAEHPTKKSRKKKSS